MSNTTNDNKSLIAGIILLISMAVVFFCAGGLTGQLSERHRQEKVVEEKIKEVYVEGEELDEWEILQMAIAKTESEYNPEAMGSSGDLGVFQITEIFVHEVNRLLGEEGYTHLDAFNVEKSIEMFNIVQDGHNPDKSISKAIAVHNPGGNSIDYGKRVYQNLAFVKRYEEMRKILIKKSIENALEEESTENRL